MIYQKLLDIQCELKAPKGQYNSFGKYNYRNCEDILEALKPLLAKHKAAVRLTDSIEMIGDRYYVRATAILYDLEDGSQTEVTAYAREELEKKGMDGSQVTGASSSYARKYALNGMFAIDDTKDSDTTNQGNQQPTQPKQQNKKPAAPKKTGTLTEETKKKINNCILQYRSLSGLDTKTILGAIKDELGFSVDSVKTDGEAKIVIDLLLNKITQYEGKGA